MKSLTLHSPLAEAIERCSRGPRTRGARGIHAWGLDGMPYGVAARPSPALRKQLDAERDKRIERELARLQAANTARRTRPRRSRDTPPTTTRATHELEARRKRPQLPPLVASPPMTLDDSLQYETGEAHDIAHVLRARRYDGERARAARVRRRATTLAADELVLPRGAACAARAMPA